MMIKSKSFSIRLCFFVVAFYPFSRILETEILPLQNMVGLVRIFIAIFTTFTFVIFIFLLTNFRKTLRHKALAALMLLTFFTLFVSFINGIFLDFPISSFIYSAAQYYIFLPISFLTYYALKDPMYFREYIRKFIQLYFLLFLMVLLNVLIDFGHYLEIQGADEDFRFDSFGNVRGNIFIPSTSTFVTLLPGVFIAYSAVSRGLLTTATFIIFIHTFLFACLFSLSRSNGVLAVFVYAVFNYYLLFGRRPKGGAFLSRFALFNFLIIAGLSFLYFLPHIVPAETLLRYQAISSSDAYGNSSRFLSWSQGLDMISSFDTVFGNGFGTSNIRTTEIFNLPYYGHFESGLISIFSERGYLGLLEIVLIVMTLIFVVKGRDRWIFSSLSIAMLISTFTAPITTGYFFSVAIGLITGVVIAHSRTASSYK